MSRPGCFNPGKEPGYPLNMRLGESQSWAQRSGEDKISCPKRFPAPEYPANCLFLMPTTPTPSLEEQGLEQILVLTNKSPENVPWRETGGEGCFLSSNDFASYDHATIVGISLILVTSAREPGIQSTLLHE
jgi:hypothetical protein